MPKKGLKNRYNVLYLVLAMMVALMVQRLFVLQIVEGENYREISDSRLARNIPIKAPRGEILDRYGRALVTNRIGLSVAISKVDDDKQKLNSVILNMVTLWKEEGLEYTDTFPISEGSPFVFTFESEDEEKNFKTNKKYDQKITAQQVIDKYKKKYEIDEDYTDAEIRMITGIRYEMESRNFSSNNPYIFANDVDIQLVTKIKEQREKYSCVTVFQEPIREYANGNLAAHILGRVGIIDAEEYAELKNQNYGMNDYLGKQGVEKAFEKYLKGTDGTSSIERKINEGKSEIVYSRDPVPGNSVILTLDLDLQKAAEESLERTIKNIARSARAGSGHDASSGAAVAIDVNSGEILALASYPTYDPVRFNQDYADLLKDPAKPMFNRALNGTYEPGSTYKMVTALAGMKEGFLSPTERIQDKGVYKYLGHDFMCNIYRTSRGTHGIINVTQALQHSCNYFFYEIGRRTGIDNINNYASLLGLGDYTGIELAGEESKGQLASPDLRKQYNRQWYPGDVLQAAIGQSDNLFTPIQLANFVATIANGGTNYKTHLLKAVKSNQDDRMTEESKAQIGNQIEIQPDYLKAIHEGMRLVAAEGTASAVFSSFDIPTAGKTGSAQVSRGSANGLYVGFAPFDNPQIAVAVVVEHGGSGGNVTPVAREIFEQYFKGSSQTGTVFTPHNELLP